MKTAVAAFTLGLVVCFSAIAPARAGGLLGALYDTCLATLGEPVNYAHFSTPAPGAEVYAFRQSGWVITVFFWRHQVHLVVYEKQAGAGIIPAETDAILRSYGDALPWTPLDHGRCSRRDGKAHAQIDPLQIAIFTTDFGHANTLYGKP